MVIMISDAVAKKCITQSYPALDPKSQTRDVLVRRSTRDDWFSSRYLAAVGSSWQRLPTTASAGRSDVRQEHPVLSHPHLPSCLFFAVTSSTPSPHHQRIQESSFIFWAARSCHRRNSSSITASPHHSPPAPTTPTLAAIRGSPSCRPSLPGFSPSHPLPKRHQHYIWTPAPPPDLLLSSSVCTSITLIDYDSR